MTEQESKNKKLAEWAGFTYTKSYVPCYGHTEKNDPDPMYLELWRNPAGEPVELHYDFGKLECAPNFTQSLDACFKWLVPKLDFGQMGIYRLDDGSWLWHLNYVGEDDKGYSERGETPALALCLAILKLVNKQEIRMNKRGLHQCYHPKVHGKRIYCAKGRRLGSANDGTLPVTKVKRGDPVELSVCQGCEDFLYMGERVKPKDRGW